MRVDANLGGWGWIDARFVLALIAMSAAGAAVEGVVEGLDGWTCERMNAGECRRCWDGK